MNEIKIEKYSSYRDSGVEWSGLVPENWGALPIRAIFEERNEKNEGRKTEYILSVTKDRGVIPYDEKGAIGNNKSEDIERYKLVYPNDFVINKMNVVIGSLGMSKYFGAFSQVYLVYKPRTSQININYYSYIFSNPSFYKSLIKYCTGIMELRESLNKDDFKKLILPFPDYQTQTAVVEYLDRKTALIDQAVDIKQKQIELLKERRQILIHQAVTRGLNAGAKLKDSGVEWIGQIPEGWEAKKLRYLANCFPSNVDKHSKANEREVRLCNYTDVYKNDYITNDLDLMIATASDEQINKFALKEGDIVITKDSETASDIAVPTYIQETLKNVVCGYHLAIIRTYQSSYSRYLYQALKTKLFNTQFEICSNGITRVGLGNSDLKNGYFLLPTQKEQIQIADFIEKESFRIAAAISLKQQEIEKLKEYKATLINSAVTGKIKISNYAK